MAAQKNGPIKAIALATAEQAVGTVPAGGSDITYAADTWASWTEIASDLADGDVGIETLEETLDIEGPLDQNRLAEVIFKKGVRSLTFGLSQISGAGFALDGLHVLGGGVGEDGTTPTYNAMYIEVKGIGGLYFPKVRIKLDNFTSGIKRQSEIGFTVLVFGTATIPSGWQWHDNS